MNKRPPSPKKKSVSSAPATGLFHSAFHNSPVLHSVVRATDATIVEVNGTFTKTFGYTRAQVLGKTPYELNFWVNPERLTVFREQMMAEGFVRNFETDVRAKNGEIRTVLLSSDKVDIDGVPHFLNAGVDISDRKRIERTQQATFQISEAAHAAEDLGSLYANIHEIIKGLMPASNFFIALFDANTGLIGFPYFVDERSPKPAPFPLGTGLTGYVLRTGKALLLDATINAGKRKVGKKVTYRGYEEICYVESGVPCATWLGAPLIVEGKSIGVMALQDYENGNAYGDEEKRILEFVATQTALAIDRKRAQQALREALVNERELNQLKSDFVTLVSHEFRTPLEIIMSSADNLQRYHERLAPDKREHLLRTINKAVRRMSGMMEEVLVLGRLETDRMTFKPAPFDLQSFGLRVCDEIEAATAKRCPVQLKVAENARAATGDENVLRHVFTNLLTNAVKYSEPGQRVDFVIERDGEDAVCRVSDRGCGIPKGDQKRVYEAFYRGANVRQVSGTGLGLLIVRRCVALHGGEIGFESTEGKGTTFTVRLPLFAEGISVATSAPRP